MSIRIWLHRRLTIKWLPRLVLGTGQGWWNDEKFLFSVTWMWWSASIRHLRSIHERAKRETESFYGAEICTDVEGIDLRGLADVRKNATY